MVSAISSSFSDRPSLAEAVCDHLDDVGPALIAYDEAADLLAIVLVCMQPCCSNQSGRILSWAEAFVAAHPNAMRSAVRTPAELLEVLSRVPRGVSNLLIVPMEAHKDEYAHLASDH